MFRLFVVLLAGLVCGCGGTRTAWNAYGPYQATLIPADSTVMPTSGSISRTGATTSFSRTRMCDLRNLSVSLPFNPVRGLPAAINIVLPQAVCRVGTHEITSGQVVVWDHPTADTSSVTGVPSDDWTVEGTLTVVEYQDLDPPEPDLDETVVTETSTGTFSLSIAGPGGERIRLQNATFQFQVTAMKFRYDPFD